MGLRVIGSSKRQVGALYISCACCISMRRLTMLPLQHFVYYRVMFDMDLFTELNKRALRDVPHTYWACPSFSVFHEVEIVLKGQRSPLTVSVCVCVYWEEALRLTRCLCGEEAGALGRQISLAVACCLASAPAHAHILILVTSLLKQYSSRWRRPFFPPSLGFISAPEEKERNQNICRCFFSLK
jgi:hypothetical protein